MPRRDARSRRARERNRPGVRAAPSDGRVAVAMSGGVDSAVALLRVGAERRRRHAAALARSRRARRRACLLLARGGARRARDLPRARAAARHARPARGVPPRGRRALRARLRARRDAEPVHPRATGASASRSCSRSRAASARRGSRPVTTRAIVEHRGRMLLARGADPDEGPVVHARAARPDAARRASAFPLGGQTKAETRAEAERAGLAAAGRRESQEACFLAGGDYRAFLERRGLDARGPDRRRARARARQSRRVLALHAGPAQGSRRLCADAALRAPDRRGDQHARRRAARVARATSVAVRGRLHVDVDRAEVKLRYRSPAVAAPGRRRPSAASGSSSTEPAYGVAAGQAAVLYEDDVVVGAGLITTARGRLRSRSVHVSPSSLSAGTTSPTWRSPSSCSRSGMSLGYAFVRLGGTLGRLSAFIKGTQEELLPGHQQDGRDGGPRERPARQGRSRDGQRRGCRRQRRHRRSHRELRDPAPVQKIAGFAAGIAHGAARPFGSSTMSAAPSSARKEAAARREARARVRSCDAWTRNDRERRRDHTHAAARAAVLRRRASRRSAGWPRGST